ncbi:sensor histidine kinase [Paludibaculum fermentans]|uniref:sensor histidine kinase n=1 Tax=Paludibaculum fermentans TaxID=1473598 RepID=UPI003EBD5DE5
MASLLLVLPMVLIVNALLMLRELEQARGAFLRDKAAQVATRLEQLPASQVMEEEPAVLDVRTYGERDTAAEPSIRPFFDGRELFRLEEDARIGFRAWVPYHAAGETRLARLDLNPAAADFLTARPRQNLNLSIAVALMMGLLTAYTVWARERQARLTRLAELGEMSAVLAHEIRNPLGALKGFLQLAQEQSSGDARVWLATSLEQTSRLEQLVKDLLSYARVPEPKWREIAWREMEERLRPHAPEALFSGADFRLTTDAGMLEQAVVNLLRNAMDAGTEVRVEATPGWIRVTDNGPGLPQEVRRKLFQPFVTTKAQGTGLGLVIVRNLVQALHGQLALSDARPTGTCAEIRWSRQR